MLPCSSRHLPWWKPAVSWLKRWCRFYFYNSWAKTFKDTQYLLIFKAIFDFIWIWIICHGSCSHLHLRKLTWTFRMLLQQRRKRRDTTHVTLILMKVNLPSQEVCTTKKSSHLLWLLQLNFIRRCEKVVLTVLQGRFSIEDKNSWLSLLFFHFIVVFILFRQGEKILARKREVVGMRSKM